MLASLPLVAGVGLANVASWRARRVALLGSPFQVAFSPDGRYVASVGGSGVDVWRAVAPTRFRAPRVEGHRHWEDVYATSICFSGDSRTLVGATSISQIGMYRWDLATGHAAPPVPSQHGSGGAYAHSVPGTGDVAYSEDAAVEQRNVRSGKVSKVTSGRGKKDADADLDRFGAFAPDGHTTAWIVDDQSGTIILRDGAKRKSRMPPLIVPSDHLQCDIWALTFSPDSRFLAVAWSADVYDAKGNDNPSGRVTVWDLKTRTVAAKWTEGSRGVGAHAFSPDGLLLAGARGDGQISLRDAHTGKLLRLLQMAGTQAASVAFSPDGTTLAGCGDDNALYLWRVK